jgi:adenosine kinase
MRREWGGCAGNIGYNLQALGGEPVVMATLGDDGFAYRERIAGLGMSCEGVRSVPGTFTAQAFIITDLDDNQITAFHPGAMNASHENRVGDVTNIALGIVAPDGREGMRTHVQQFAAARIPFVFDPGQGLPLFSGPELVEMIEAASFVAVNDYEGRLLAERTGLSLEAIAARVDALIVTLGGEGSRIHTDGRAIDLPAVATSALVDPTGCGDAYRAGLLYGIAHGWEWERTGRLAATLGAIKIASRGGQNHRIDRDIIAQRFHAAFGDYPW